MSQVSFYSVKLKASVQMPEDKCWKVKYSSKTKSGKTQTRYAVRSEDKNGKLTRFITEAAFKAMKCPEKKA